MSEHCGFVVKVKELRPHTNADRLQILRVFEEDVMRKGILPAINVSFDVSSLRRAPDSYSSFQTVRNFSSAPLSMHSSFVALPSVPLF